MTYIILLTLNILLIRLIRQERKYWVISIPIWTILIVTFILWRSHHDNNYKQLESSYWKSAENKPFGDIRISKQMNESKKYVHKYNMTFIHAIALQTILTFIFQIIGYRETQEKALQVDLHKFWGIGVYDNNFRAYVGSCSYWRNDWMTKEQQPLTQGLIYARAT